MLFRRYYERYNTAERVCHWLVAVSFFLLVITGLGLFDKAFLRYFDVLGGGSKALAFHKAIGVIFLVSSVILFLKHWRETTHFDADDAGWLKCMGGYLSKDRDTPPMGKFNTGQKIFGNFVFFGTLGLGITGLIAWDPLLLNREIVRWCMFFHSLLFVMMTVFVVIHIYLGTMGNPGTMEGILYGQVSEVWAMKHAPKWLAEQEGYRKEWLHPPKREPRAHPDSESEVSPAA